MSAPQPELTIRPARTEDLDVVAQLAGSLVRMHHAWDPQRFMLPEPVEPGYRRWLSRELADADAVVLVAERAGRIVGYTYGRLEARDFNLLLDACGALHDVYVEESARRHGVARALVQAMLAALEAKGAPRVVLSTAWQNGEARAFFSRLGFRPTMVEMTRESRRE